jgi:hypothetical protein
LKGIEVLRRIRDKSSDIDYKTIHQIDTDKEKSFFAKPMEKMKPTYCTVHIILYLYKKTQALKFNVLHKSIIYLYSSTISASHRKKAITSQSFL